MSAFETVSKGLEEALAFANGDLADAKVHEVSVAEVDVAEVRQRTGLSQAEFAKSIGVAKGTLLNWEHGRRHPTGPAQVLRSMRHPSLSPVTIRTRSLRTQSCLHRWNDNLRSGRSPRIRWTGPPGRWWRVHLRRHDAVRTNRRPRSRIKKGGPAGPPFRKALRLASLSSS
mgnify:CR=1 FL=1